MKNLFIWILLLMSPSAIAQDDQYVVGDVSPI